MSSCEQCGFDLWIPIASLEVADLGLYSDGRFPGRCILKIREHFDSLEELPEETALAFLRDTQKSMAAIRLATNAERVNFAVLGNAVAHVHGHLIPRFPGAEERPKSSPWDDPRPRCSLPSQLESEIRVAIGNRLR